ncbi:hypothetical protein QR98_0104230 [Sarcoptes scabiei]|uniref:Uncharacterized protein n=1 Tax=Sarcoptes scabiei TaxID=52283 RepID=A0A132ALP2_SARSC|nr:hypothetical protein QR98_0104230 [Sarcoptes scabiei]
MACDRSWCCMSSISSLEATITTSSNTCQSNLANNLYPRIDLHHDRTDDRRSERHANWCRYHSNGCSRLHCVHRMEEQT